jgi:hypothetical protein
MGYDFSCDCRLTNEGEIMNVLLIAYNLRRPDRNHSRISFAIQNLGVWCHLMEYVWIVKSDSSPEIIRNILLQYTDPDDTLFVTELSGISAWSGFSLSDSDWLKNQFLLVSTNKKNIFGKANIRSA